MQTRNKSSRRGVVKPSTTQPRTRPPPKARALPPTKAAQPAEIEVGTDASASPNPPASIPTRRLLRTLQLPIPTRRQHQTLNLPLPTRRITFRRSILSFLGGSLIPRYRGKSMRTDSFRRRPQKQRYYIQFPMLIT